MSLRCWEAFPPVRKVEGIEVSVTNYTFMETKNSSAGKQRLMKGPVHSKIIGRTSR